MHVLVLIDTVDNMHGDEIKPYMLINSNLITSCNEWFWH